MYRHAELRTKCVDCRAVLVAQQAFVEPAGRGHLCRRCMLKAQVSQHWRDARRRGGWLRALAFWRDDPEPRFLDASEVPTPNAQQGRELNGRTRVVQMRPTEKPLGARDAFIAVYKRMSDLQRSNQVPGFIVAAVSPHGRLVSAAHLADGQAIVAGRHTRCGLRLPDKGVALRHLVAHVRGGDNGLATRLWDLNTSRPFLTEDGQTNEAVIAEGFLYVTVGRYALLFVPTGPWLAAATPYDGWDQLPARQFVDRRKPSRNNDRLHHEIDAAPEHTTRVTQVRPATMLGEGDGPAWANIHVRYDGGKSARVAVALEHVQRGVLIGRYDRCSVQFAKDDNISRVHMMLVRIGNEVWAIDTASTNGSQKCGEKVHACILVDEDSVELGGSQVKLAWRFLHGDA